MLRAQAAWVVLAVLTPEQISHMAHGPGSNKEGKGPAPSLCPMAVPFRCMQGALRSSEESLQWPLSGSLMSCSESAQSGLTSYEACPRHWPGSEYYSMPTHLSLVLTQLTPRKAGIKVSRE